eukprot:gnl/Chilomastix_cuspidata/8631.p1 GENE.gnl/Chilomastix_cuspidata/8631~~gnl/Chilomastix_cuspidata/8631.p1  ORF type:complete len:156 (+),score=17.68 gnl/Chilomastix_cuspidata/8631:143-610(+)
MICKQGEVSMQIPAYQIHNVLKAYSRQVSQNKLNAKAKASGMNNTSVDKISISAEGKKQGVIDKVASDIVKKITSNGPSEKFEKDIVSRLEKELGKKLTFPEETKSSKEFRYYEIDGSSKKINTFSFHDSDLVKKKMEDLTKDLLSQELKEDKGE